MDYFRNDRYQKLITVLTEAIHSNLLIESSLITPAQFKKLTTGNTLIKVSTEGNESVITVATKGPDTITDQHGTQHTFKDLKDAGYGIPDVDTKKKQSIIITPEFLQKVYSARPSQFEELKEELRFTVETSGINQNSKTKIHEALKNISNFSAFVRYVTDLELKKHGLGVR